jgi:hypothetical protein
VNPRSNATAPRTALLALVAAVAATAICASLGFQNPARSDAAAARIEALEARAKAAESRLQTLEDIGRIEKLQRAYGYYVDKNLWDQVVDLFADDCSVEIAQRGVYLGKKGADRLFRMVFGGGKIGLPFGRLFNHMMLQGIVHVDPSGLTAKGRWRAFVQIAQYQKSAMWSDGVYENEYVKDNGVWKLKRLKFWPTFYTPYETGWAVKNLPNNSPNKDFPPDQPPTDSAGVFPDSFVPPFHYRNPVTGK